MACDVAALLFQAHANYETWSMDFVDDNLCNYIFKNSMYLNLWCSSTYSMQLTLWCSSTYSMYLTLWCSSTYSMYLTLWYSSTYSMYLTLWCSSTYSMYLTLWCSSTYSMYLTLWCSSTWKACRFIIIKRGGAPEWNMYIKAHKEYIPFHKIVHYA